MNLKLIFERNCFLLEQIKTEVNHLSLFIRKLNSLNQVDLKHLIQRNLHEYT